jgi:hypothetical protein
MFLKWPPSLRVLHFWTSLFVVSFFQRKAWGGGRALLDSSPCWVPPHEVAIIPVKPKGSRLHIRNKSFYRPFIVDYLFLVGKEIFKIVEFCGQHIMCGMYRLTVNMGSSPGGAANGHAHRQQATPPKLGSYLRETSSNTQSLRRSRSSCTFVNLFFISVETILQLKSYTITLGSAEIFSSLKFECF